MKDRLPSDEELARIRDQVRHLETSGVLAEAMATQRWLRERGILERAPERFELARSAGEYAGVLSAPAAENAEPAEHQQVLRLRSRIHGRVPPAEEQRIIETARRLLMHSTEWIPSTDLDGLGMDSKTVWNVFQKPNRSSHVRGTRPRSYHRGTLLDYLVDEYWPRGCPKSQAPTKPRRSQIRPAGPQT